MIIEEVSNVCLPVFLLAWKLPFESDTLVIFHRIYFSVWSSEETVGLHPWARLWAVSLLLKTPCRECDQVWQWCVSSDAPSRVGVSIISWAKRETATVSYNILDALHSGDGVILLVRLWSYDTYLSVTFISDMQHTPNSVVMFVFYGATPIVCDIIDTI